MFCVFLSFCVRVEIGEFLGGEDLVRDDLLAGEVPAEVHAQVARMS